jgi:hypothetical protein
MQQAFHPDCLWSMISQSQISQHEEKHWVISEHCSEDIITSNIEICTEYMIEGTSIARWSDSGPFTDNSRSGSADVSQLSLFTNKRTSS